MRGLKALVIGMAILIFAGVVMLIVGIVNKTGDPAEKGTGFDATTVALPAGAKLREIRIDGDRIVLRIDLADGNARLLIIDARSGRRTGTIDLK